MLVEAVAQNVANNRIGGDGPTKRKGSCWSLAETDTQFRNCLKCLSELATQPTTCSTTFSMHACQHQQPKKLKQMPYPKQSESVGGCLQIKSGYKRSEVISCRVEKPIKDLLYRMSRGNINEWLYDLITEKLAK